MIDWDVATKVWNYYCSLYVLKRLGGWCWRMAVAWAERRAERRAQESRTVRVVRLDEAGQEHGAPQHLPLAVIPSENRPAGPQAGN